MSERIEDDVVPQASGIPKTLRFNIGPWIKTTIAYSLLVDALNYPPEFREDVWAMCYRTLEADVSISRIHLEHTQCFCLACISTYLQSKLFLGDSVPETIEGVLSSTVLPRYTWYKHELIRLYGFDACFDTTLFEVPADDDESDEEADEAAAVSLDGELEFIGAEPVVSRGVNITDQVVITNSGDAPKKIQVVQLDDDDEEQMDGSAAPINENVSTFSMAIKEIQFRLAKHGVLADPKTYKSAKGRDEVYDENDPWLDDDEDLANILLQDLSSDSSGDEAEGHMEEWNSDMDEVYEEREHLFVFDNFSEEEEEVIKKTADGQRVIKEYSWAKPSTLPNVYNPRSWAHNNRRTQLAPFTQLFFKMLEYTLPSKKVQVLQKNIYDKYEWVIVNEIDNTLSLNEDGINAVSGLVEQAIKAAYATFLLPFSSHTVQHLTPTELPQFAKYVRVSEFENPFTFGLPPPDPEIPKTIYQILDKVITPFAPSEDWCLRLYAISITTFTLRRFLTIEDRINAVVNGVPEEISVTPNNNTNSGEKPEHPPSVPTTPDDYLPVMDSIESAALAFIRAVNIRRSIANNLITWGFLDLAIVLVIPPSSYPEDGTRLSDIGREDIINFVDTPISVYLNDHFSSLPEFIRVVEETLCQTELNLGTSFTASQQPLPEIKKREPPTTLAQSFSRSSKRLKDRNLIAELLTNLGGRLVDSLLACPYVMPINLGVSVIYNRTPGIAVIALNQFNGFNGVAIKISHISPPQESVSVDADTTFTCMNAVMDSLVKSGFIIEGRSRSMVYSGFDNKVKAYCLALLPLDLCYARKTTLNLNSTDFLKSTSYSFKSRLSLLDILMLSYYIHGDGKGSIDYKYLFASDSGVKSIAVEKDIDRSIAVSRAEVKENWRKILDRYIYSQLLWLRIVQNHWVNVS